MQEVEKEEIQNIENRKKKKRDSTMEEGEMDSRYSNMDCLIGEISENSEKNSKKKKKKKKEKKRENEETKESTDVEKNEEEADLKSRKDEKKKEKRKKKEISDKEDTSSSSPELLLKGFDGMNVEVQKGREISKNKAADEESPKLGINGHAKEKKKKDRRLNDEKYVIEKVSDDVENRIGNVKESELDKSTVHRGGKESVEDVKGRKIGKYKNSDKESVESEECKGSGIKKEKKRKKTYDSAESEKDEKTTRKKLKQVLSTEDNGTAEDASDGVPSNRDANNGKRKRKKEKEKAADSLGLSLEGISNKHKADMENFKEKAIGKETSSVRNERCSNDSKTSRSKKKPRRVSFSGEVEVFPPTDNNDHKECDEDGLVRGKRFSLKEDELVKEAVLKYIETNQLGEEGLHMVLHCGSYPKVRKCWKEIGASLPWRPYSAVYYRAHILFERSEKRKWEPEEYEMIRRFHAENGPAWKTLANALGKQRLHVKDTWRRIRLPNRKIGQWSQDEYQCLFDLVNLDLKMKAFEEKKTKHGMLRDNISWEAISQKLSTRGMHDCCNKWYSKLESPLVKQELWASSDDYRLMYALQNQDACCVEDVEWDSLLEHRSGEVCRKRWDEVVRHIGGNREKPFIEQVDVLAKRYCPDMLNYRK